jgi:RimJ/RimL family protein N-acetyltransferase
MIRLLPLDDTAIDLVAAWLADEQNAPWLDFGPDVPVVSPLVLRAMARRDAHHLRLFAPEDATAPVGIVGLSGIGRLRRTANLWYVLGDKRHAGRGHTHCAVRRMLDDAFGQLELASVSAWAVEQNVASIRVLEKNGFRLIGRQRHCHWIDGAPVDRLLFDLVREEHLERALCANCNSRTI